MHLTDEESSWLAGDAGQAMQRAMEIIVALGKIYGAERLIPVESVQISGVSYRNIGDAGLEFLNMWAEEGARVSVPTTLNPTAMDMVAWQSQGFDPDFAEKQRRVVDAFAHMGVGEGQPMPSCTPYLIGNRPSLGSHVAWAESSAVSFANSVLGARTNREGGPGAIAAAIAGRTGAYGLHLDEARYATVRVEVRAVPDSVSDYSALGALVGSQVAQAVPYFVGLPIDIDMHLAEEKLKALGAAMAATGAVALYHVEGVTPEARAAAMLSPDHEPLVIDDVMPGYVKVSDEIDDVDLIWIGCPHASVAEIERVAKMVKGRKLRLPLWITCARPVHAAAVEEGFAATIEDAGGWLFADACMAIAPVRALGFQSVATPSAKGAFYLRNLARVRTRFAPLQTCVEIALVG